MLNRNFDPELFVILACNPAIKFANRVIDSLNKNHLHKDLHKKIQLGKIKSELHPGGENNIIINENVRGRNVHLFQCFRQLVKPTTWDDVGEMLVIMDALLRAGAATISVYNPYLPFQRQDRKTQGREAISARLYFDLLYTAAGNRLKRIVTEDMHTGAAAGFTKIPLDNLTAWTLWVAYIKEKLQINFSDIVIVAPDTGAAKKAEYYTKIFGCKLAMIYKIRSGPGLIEEVNLNGNVQDKIAVLVDDMIGTGGTLIKSGLLLKEAGAKEVYAFATHGLFNIKNDQYAEELFYKSGIKVVITDSIPQKHKNYYQSCNKWLDNVVSISGHFADALYCNETANSLSRIMTAYENIDQTCKTLKDLIIT